MPRMGAGVEGSPLLPLAGGAGGGLGGRLSYAYRRGPWRGVSDIEDFVVDLLLFRSAVRYVRLILSTHR